MSAEGRGPCGTWSTRHPQNEIGRWRHAAVPPKQLRTLSPMAVRVHAHLHQSLRHGTLATRNMRVFQDPCEIVLAGGLEPRGFLRLSAAVSLDQCIERGGGASLVVENERLRENSEQPEAICEQNVME